MYLSPREGFPRNNDTKLDFSNWTLGVEFLQIQNWMMGLVKAEAKGDCIEY